MQRRTLAILQPVN